VHIQKKKICLEGSYLLQEKEEQDLNIPEETLNAIIPLVWSTGIPGKDKADPVKVEMKPDAKPVRRKQYPMKTEDKVGLQELINKCPSQLGGDERAGH